MLITFWNLEFIATMLQSPDKACSLAQKELLSFQSNKNKKQSKHHRKKDFSMINLNLNREKPGGGLKKLANGDKIGLKLLKERVVVAAEVLFVSELGDYNGVTVRMTLEEARQFQKDLAEAIDRAEKEFGQSPSSSESN